MNEREFRLTITGILGVITLCSSLGNAAGEENTLNPEELRGRNIYRTGVSGADHKIQAAIGGGTNLVDGSLMPCLNCHSRDGRGRPEAGVVPASLRWTDLTRPYEVSATNVRRRGPYDERLLVRAITLGIDSSGNRLSPAMPRYSLARNDAYDLVSYLKKLSSDRDPGLTDDTVAIGVLLPAPDKFPQLAAAIRGALTAYFAEINRAGGIYGRRVEILTQELTGEAAPDQASFHEIAQQEKVFALLSSFVAGSEGPIAEALLERRLPLVGAWTLLPPRASEDNPYVFYPDSGIVGQAENLADYAFRHGAAKTAMLVSGDELSRSAAARVKARLVAAKVSSIEEIDLPSGASGIDSLIRRLKLSGTDTGFLCLRKPDLVEIVDAVRRIGWKAMLLVPGGVAGVTIDDLKDVPGKPIVAVPLLPSDIARESAAAYQKLAHDYSLPTHQLAAQLRALADARVLVEGLQRAGRDLTRERLIESLEGLYEFSPGFGPLISFGPHRRIGSTQCHLLTHDPETGKTEKIR